MYLHGSHRNKIQGFKETQNNKYTKNACSLNVKHTNMHGFPNDASADRGTQGGKVPWSNDGIERPYSSSRKRRLPMYQAKI